MIQTIIPSTSITQIDQLPVVTSNKYDLKIGDSLVLSFLNDLSKAILKNPIFKTEPSFISLGFWLRKANLRRIIEENKPVLSIPNVKIRPIGCVFHLCPSNVDTMFIYSLVIFLLGGNKNIVRLSSTINNLYINTVFELINSLLKQSNYSILNTYINVITYNRSDKTNETLSLLADGRVIWGGDETINQFKLYKTKPKVKDLYFTDKISLCVLSIPSLETFNEHKETIALHLFNDIFTFNQKGCSSPHSILLLCENKENRNAIIQAIYNEISSIAKIKYQEDLNSIASMKFNQSIVDIIDKRVDHIINHSNFLTFSHSIHQNNEHSCGAGYVYYNCIDSIEDISNHLQSKTQTLTYWGICKDDLNKVIENAQIDSIDRVVPIGQALNFDYIWDGYNIFLEGLVFKSLK